MPFARRMEDLLIAAHGNATIDAQDAALVAEYDELEALGYVTVKKRYSHMSADQPLYAVAVLLTAEGQQEVQSILRRRQ